MNLANREQWLYQTIKKIPMGSRILDAGAGELQYKKFCEHLDYVSQDFAQYDGLGDEKGLQTKTWDQTRLDIISDIASVPEPDASFDAIMCVEVLEHIPHPVEALREFSRLLKSGGYLVLTAPFNSLTHFAPYFYQTGYSNYFYEYWLEKLGFKILDIQKNGNYFEYLAQELSRLPSVADQYSSARMTWLEHKAQEKILAALRRLSSHDMESNQLLCFGVHVFAQKKFL